MVRKRFDLKIRKLFKDNGIPLVSNKPRANPLAGALVTQYNHTKVIIVLNGFMTVEECYRLLDGILQKVEVIIYK